jgi:hypothetical protein
MKRSWNWWLWVGFFLVIAAPVTYLLWFVWLPATRDFPWLTLLIFAAGGILLAVGLIRAFRRPELYRGKIFGSVFALLSLAAFGFFAYGLFYIGRQVPAAKAAPQAGQKAADFTLPDQNGKPVSLVELLSSSKGKRGGALLIFYRGYW